MKIHYYVSGFFWIFCYLLIKISVAETDSSHQSKPSLKDFMRLNARIHHAMDVVEQMQEKVDPLLGINQTKNEAQFQKLFELNEANAKQIQLLQQAMNDFLSSNKAQDFNALSKPIWNSINELKTSITKLTKSTDGTPLISGLNCGDTCFRLNNIVYFIYPYVGMTWFQARAKCASEGMSMAMIKDSTTHQFLRQKLKAYYAKDASKQDAFWIGLRRESLTSEWKWVDGSVLSGYEGWAFKPVHNDLCINVGNTKRFDFNWDADSCDVSTGSWTYYALCQKEIIALG